MILSADIAGEAKVGKSHFGLTAPDPIVVFDFDQGIQKLLPKFKDKDIKVIPIVMDVWGKEKVSPLWDEFYRKYKDVLESDCKTIMMDTATQLWEILRLAHFERVQKESKIVRIRLQPVEYAEANSLMRAIIAAAKAHGKNLVLTHYVRDVYDDSGRKTGEKEADQFRHTPGLCDLSLKFTAKRKKGGKGEDTQVLIERCRDDRELVGEILTNPTWDTIRGLLE